MNKGDKLIQAMQEGTIEPYEAINQSLEIAHKEKNSDGLDPLVNALFYGMLRSEKIYAAIHEDGPISAQHIVVTTEEMQKFFLQTATLPNGYKVILMYTGRDKLKLVPQVRYLEIGLDEFFVFIEDLDAQGILINPGPTNFFVPIEVVKGLVEQWKEFCQTMEKESKKQ